MHGQNGLTQSRATTRPRSKNVARRTKWDAKLEASYETLVRSAVQVFHDQGYAAATVADIVAGAGYTSGAFYWHFTNKADCFWHVIAYREQLRGDWSILAAELDPSTVSLEELLVRVFSHFAESLGGFTEWVLVMVDFHQQHRQHQEALARLAEIYGRWRDEVRRFVDALVVNGWIEAPADPALLAHQVFAFAEGLTVHGALYGRSENLAITERALIEGLVKLLRC